ncbi:MAG: TonB-dependent receptor [Prevotellaceae bacterium]|jgi:hypothetical protein|nr:TonB-dependent receptor [Prevotellaceae bacterium]
MRKLFIVVVFWGIANISFSQTDNRIVLTNIGLDSLKKVVEHHTDFKLFYVEDVNETPRILSVSWNQSNFFANLCNAIEGIGYSLSHRDGILYVLKGIGIMTHLPDQYFSSTEKAQDSIVYSLALSSSKSQEIGSVNKVYTIGDPLTVFSGTRARLSGYIKNQSNGEPIVGAIVSVAETGANVVTDISGFYRISVPLGRTGVKVKELGFVETNVLLEVFGDGVLDIVIKEIVYSLSGVVVSAEASEHKRSTYLGIEKLQISRIKKIPVVFGEADVLKVMLTLPGVKTVGEASGGFNVRGGATDQNLIIFNEGTLYNPTHLFGLFSAFNPDVVSDIELYKSTIPAKYGGRISSVLEVKSRYGNSNKITGSAGIGLLTGKLHLEGPIIKDRTNFIVGARTTYSNWILGLIPQNSGYRDGAANFYDVSAGLNHKVNSSNSFHLYAYYSSDRFSFSRDTTYSYDNLNIATKWRSVLSSRHIMNLSAGYDRYKHQIVETANPLNAFSMGFGLEQYFAKVNFDLIVNDKHSLNYGINGVFFDISPGTYSPNGEESIVSYDSVDKEQGLELAMFISDKWEVSDRFKVDMGIRYGLFSTMKPAKFYQGPEFRLSASYLIEDMLMIKGGINTMRQNIHMLSNTASVSPIDIWKLSDSNIAPQTGWQAALGLYRNIFKNKWELSVEGYYKALNHYLDYKSGAILNMNKHIEEDAVETEGKAYGLELMLKKSMGKLNGWLAYTYSKTMLRESGIKESYEINEGRWYPAVYDKPHDVKLILNYKFTQRYSFSTNLDFSSGRPVTIPISVYYYGGGYRLEYSNRNQYRIPDYFRLDLAFNIEPSHNLTLLTHSIITFGVYNVTGRKNAFSVYYQTNEGRKIQGYMLSIFGAPIPYINYTIKF